MESFLEFGGQAGDDETTRAVYDRRVGQQAYDWFMLARYMADLLGYRDLSDMCASGALDRASEKLSAGIHHDDDVSINLSKYVALGVLRETGGAQTPQSFMELGSTIMGCIEGMAFCKALLGACGADRWGIDLGDVEWEGIDNSVMLNRVASLVHPHHTIRTYEDYPPLGTKYDLFFAKGVSLLYKIESLEELMRVLGMARLSLFDYSFSIGEPTVKYIGSGKRVHYLSRRSFSEELKRLEGQGYAFKVRAELSRFRMDRGMVFVHGVLGNEDDVVAFIEADGAARTAIRATLKADLADLVLAGVEGGKENWLPFETLIERGPEE